jgi:hypothetical protein
VISRFAIRKQRGRRPLAALAVLSIVAGVLVFGSAALAVNATGRFELDGNATTTVSDDWDEVCHQVVGSDCGTTNNTNGATAVSWVSEPDTSATIFTGGGSKDPQDPGLSWAWKNAGGLPDKDNLLHGFAARYSLAPNATTCPAGSFPTCEVIFFGSDRDDNSGDAVQGFWFFQQKIELGSAPRGGGFAFTGNHVNDDLLILSDFSNGGSTSTIAVYFWDDTCDSADNNNPQPEQCGAANLRLKAKSDAANCASSSPTAGFCGIVNPTNGTVAPWPYTDKSGNSTYLQGEFFEGGVNLSTLGLGGTCFSSVASETRSSTSPTATLKDFVLGGFGACTSGIASTQTWSPNDSATVTVGGAATWSGTLQFKLYEGSASCGGTLIYTSDAMPVSNATPTKSTTNSTTQPAAISTAAAGTSYSWQVIFDSSTDGVPDSTSCIEASTLGIDNDTTTP